MQGLDSGTFPGARHPAAGHSAAGDSGEDATSGGTGSLAATTGHELHETCNFPGPNHEAGPALAPGPQHYLALSPS